MRVTSEQADAALDHNRQDEGDRDEDRVLPDVTHDLRSHLLASN
jgi:hypothetical protein